jgi:predicted homoserine dehydrogenase-like protein
MNLYAKLLERKDRPLRIGVIGAGKFGAMYIAQVPRTPGVHLVGIADLSPDYARKNLERVGWPKESYAASSLDARSGQRRTPTTGEARRASRDRHHHRGDRQSDRGGRARAGALRHGKHVVMVTVEADAFCGPLLAQKARGGRGLQPRLRRPAGADLRPGRLGARRGFPGGRGGRGHKWLPHFAQSTPETVWGYYGLTPEQAKSAASIRRCSIRSSTARSRRSRRSAVCNATGLTPAPEGLLYPPGSVDEIPALMRPRARAACCTTRARSK